PARGDREPDPLPRLGRGVVHDRIDRGRRWRRDGALDGAMPASLVRGRYVITRTDGRDGAGVLEDAALFQRDRGSREIGPEPARRERHPADLVVGSADHVVLPGLVNAHHHVGLTPFQLGSPDHPLELWFASRLGARTVDPYLDTLYSAFEMLESGIT